MVDATTIRTTNMQLSIIGTIPIGKQQIFYAQKRYWLFSGYTDGFAKMYYMTSEDGVTWSTPTQFATEAPSGLALCIDEDGEYVHYCRGGSLNTLLYRRGQLNTDGTITWTSAEVNTNATAAPDKAAYSYIILDSNGCPWIGYAYYDIGGGTQRSYVVKSTKTDGTWATAAGFPVKLSDTAIGTAIHGHILKLSGGNMYAFILDRLLAGYGKLYTSGVGWGAEETITKVGGAAVNTLGGALIALADDDGNIHAIWVRDLGGTYQLYHSVRDATTGTWGNGTAISAVLSDEPSITACMDGNTENIYVFYPSNDDIYVTIYSHAIGSWNTPSAFISGEGTFVMGVGTFHAELSSFHKVVNRRIAVIWERNTSSPYDVRLGMYSIPSALKSAINSL